MDHDSAAMLEMISDILEKPVSEIATDPLWLHLATSAGPETLFDVEAVIEAEKEAS